MVGKIKFIIIFLVAILITSLFINLNIYNAKKTVERERDVLKNETELLAKKVEEGRRDAKQFKEKIDSLANDLGRAFREKQEIQDQREAVQRKYKLLTKERHKLIEKLKSVKEKNTDLRQQVKSLSNWKGNSEKKLAQLKEEKTSLERRLDEMSSILEDSYKGFSQGQELDTISSGDSEQLVQSETGSVELPPIFVHSQPEISTQQKESVLAVEGKVLEVNKKNNFVIIDLGEYSGIKSGDTFGVYRKDKAIATIEVIQIRKRVAACDITQEIKSIRVGDTIR
ncbi:MAG: hypothetical protein KKE91_02840 [Candidatus Omnitrophica bacterium]|nr:hypothetical protein [Candidatus Omnitrophota bacterium]